MSEAEGLRKDIRWLEDALASQAIERDRRVKEILSLRAEVERMTKQRDLWIADAERYCQNADYWRIQCEQLTRERDQIIEKCAEVAVVHFLKECGHKGGTGEDYAEWDCTAAIRALKGNPNREPDREPPRADRS